MDDADSVAVSLLTEILGNDVSVFIGLTVILFGGAAYLTGQAVAQIWRPLWQVIPYGAMLTIGSRFLSFALFDGELLSITGFLVDWVVLSAIAALAYRLMQARLMVRQYPWLYERSGPFGWREKRT